MGYDYDITGAKVRANTAEGLSDFFRGVFTWMTSGLAITGVVSYLIATDKPVVQYLYTHIIIFYLLIGLQLAAVLGLSFGINKIPAAVSEAIFLLYSALTGVTFSFIFLVYTNQSIGEVFFITAASFGLLAFLGYTTKRDLTEMGNFMMVGLFAIIIAMVVNFFLHSSMLMYIVSILGVVIFLGLTAYDMQKLKQIYLSGSFDERKETVMGALTLYLDFINLFLMLLNLFGQRRD
ncbi:MAG: Bax inhibitor-1/YccA family protein [bacterium]